MKLPRRNFLRLAAGAAALSGGSRIAQAQTYPTRPVRLILGYAPGGAPDIVARLIGEWLSQRFGQPFIIENRPGGASNVGTEAVVRAPADGYTLLYVTTANAINATLARQRATYDEILVQQQAEFEQRYAALRDELFAKIDNELGPVIATLRRELAAANAELARLRAAQPAH